MHARPGSPTTAGIAVIDIFSRAVYDPKAGESGPFSPLSPSRPPMQLPAAFGRYQLLERIAVGGMAEVFLARSFGVEGFEKRLVIKRILPELAQNPRFVSMFVHEAKLSVCLSHPNVVQVFELGKVGEDHYIAMEHIHGRDLTYILRTLRRTGERVPPALAAGIAAKVARGLGYAHARTAPDGRALQIVHRDVSPHNIVVSFEGDVKLVDFGIARLVGDTDAGPSARPGGGKFAYMSPEQAAGRALDARSDIFSLGSVLFEMLTGRRLFAESDPELKLRAVIACEVPDVRSVNPDVPDGLAHILDRVLRADPADRYDSATLMEEDLRAYLFESGERSDASRVAEWLRALLPEDAAGARANADLDLLAQDLQDLHTGVDPEPTHSASSISSMPESSRTSTDDRPARLLALRGERRSVVVLVAEVNGLTDVSARAETEDIARLHYRMLRTVRGLIDRMGGTAERFEDDTLFVFFGLPRVLGDDLDRALACARELHRLAARLRKRGIAIEFSVGVHVGDLTVTRKAGRHYRYAARGDTLKATVRLAYAAEPGTTLVSDRVAALAGDRFPFDRGPQLRRKGTRHTRPTFLLAGGRRAGVRSNAGRYIRRAEELEVLRAAIAGLREGRGSQIGIHGEAGVGKTRLVREFRELVARRKLPVFHGRALPYGGDRALVAFRDLLADILGIRADTTAAGVRECLQRLGELGLEDADIQIISALFALELGERREPPRDATLAAGARLVRGLAKDGPVVFLLEDIQYFDALEEQLFAHLLRVAQDLPVLVLVSWRGDAAERLVRNLEVVHLGPLSRDQVAAMAADLLGAEGIGPDLTRLVSRTAEGNPLYLEEILKALHQAGRIYFEGKIARLKDPQVDPGLPDTLQGLVAARIDRLDGGSRGALQVAAVLGLGFSPALLAAAVGADDPMLLIGELVRSGLIVPEDRAPESDYSFASVLIWESVLRGILGIQRREYHRMIASGMERLYGDRLEALREAWANHAHAGGRIRDAAAAVGRAGDLHRASQALERAMECYLRGIGWIEGAPREERDDAVEAALHLGAGEVAVILGRPRAQSHLQVAMDLAGEGGPAEIEARAMLALGQLYQGQGKGMMARAHLEAAAAQAAKLRDRPSEIAAIESLGALALDENRHEDAARFHAKGLALAGDDPALAARIQLGMASHALRRDDLETAVSLLQEALPRARASGDRILIGRILNNLGLVFFSRGRYDLALVEFRRSLEAREGLGYRIGEVVNLHNIGDAHLRLGNAAHAWASFEKSREVAVECGYERGVVMNDVFLHYLQGLRGEDVLVPLERAGRRALELGDKEISLTARWFLARLLGRGVDGGGEDLLEQVASEAVAAGLVSFAREIQMGG